MVLSIAQEINHHSEGLFNCGIGYRLVASGLLPRHFDIHIGTKANPFGGIEHLQFLEPTLVRSATPLCLDLGGIAKGFAVDLAVNVLQSAAVPAGLVNAGGDLRVFGNEAQDFESYNDKIWNDKYIQPNNDVFLPPHFNNGHSLFRESYMNNKLFFTGTEVSPQFSGYMEGAIIASIATHTSILRIIKK
jgi:hypothetical protein